MLRNIKSLRHHFINMKLLLTLVCIIAFSAACFSQSNNQAQQFSYAYITIEGKGFSKKLKVDVDLGDTPEQVQAGKEYSEILTNKKSYAAVLNYMAEHQYELVESRDINSSFQGTGGSSGIVLIMRKKQHTGMKE